MGAPFLWIIAGLISVAGGILALLNPFAATLLATVLAAWVFLLVGAIQIIGGFGAAGLGTKIWTILLGVLAVVLGISILNHPLAAVLTLTTLVAIVFLAAGVAKVVLAFSLENRRYFWLILLSGALSVLLAVLIFAEFPQSAATILGVLLGVDLISNGVSLVAMGLALRSAARI